VRIAEYGPHRRADVASLTESVWGERPPEAELEWLYERNPVRPASVLLGEDDDGRVVGVVAMSFLRMAIGGEEVVVGMPVGLATDPAHRGRGVFLTLQRTNEERAREEGVRLLLIVPNAASAAILTSHLGWTPLPPLRVWARVRASSSGALGASGRSGASGAAGASGASGPPGNHSRRSRGRARQVNRFTRQVTLCHKASGPARELVLRDAAYLDWRFADAPRPYVLLEGGDGYAVAGRRRRAAVTAVSCGGLLSDVAAASGSRLLVAAPPPWERGRYALAGYVPTPRTFTVLGKSLHPAQPLPARPHFELGDLDFF
jgi:GNAT superfamily N-acetyltransferase